MAVVASQTVTHVPFPSRVQYKSLEADGLAVGRLASVGDGSGGNVLHTFEGQAGFLYVLRNCSAEIDEAGATNNEPDIFVRFDAQWLANAGGLAQGDYTSVISMVVASANGATLSRVPNPDLMRGMISDFETLLLGEISRTGVFDILAMSHRKNVLSNNYVSMVLFDVYRTEALTVPGILDRLRYGLIR